MKFEFNFGTLRQSRPVGGRRDEECFRIAVLGDFSARAHRGQLATGRELARRKPWAVDIDRFDDVMRRLGIRLQLPLGEGGEALSVTVENLEDFHPDTLYDRLKIFGQLGDWRRRLQQHATFAEAAREVQASLGAARSGTVQPPAQSGQPRGTAVPDGQFADFSRLLGRPAARPTAAEIQVEQLIKQVVGPHIVPSKDPAQEQLVAAVDAALSEAMRRVLHQADFQAVEALWRSVDLLTRRLETGPDLQIVLYDISAEEFAADLAAVDALDQTGLYSLLVEQPLLDAQQGPWSVILADYTFSETAPHAALLGRVAQIAAAAGAPWIANFDGAYLRDSAAEIDAGARQAWTALRQLPQAAYLGLTLPRYLVRLPYGKSRDPIERFALEEFLPDRGERGLLWGNSAILVGLLMGQGFRDEGLAGVQSGSVLTVDDLPLVWYRDADGESVAVPCTEFLLTEQLAIRAVEESWMPIVAIRGRPEVRLAGFRSLAGGALGANDR
jgi:type VI secretion system protein ImpC